MKCSRYRDLCARTLFHRYVLFSALAAVFLIQALSPGPASAARFGVPAGPLDPSGYFILTGPDVPIQPMDNLSWGDKRHAIDFYIEVTGYTLTVGIFDPGLVSATAGNLDLFFSGTVGQVTYTLYDASAAQIAQGIYQSDTEGPGGTNLALVTLYDGPAQPGLYRLNVTMDDTATDDEDINAFGVSVPGYDFYSYYFTGGESNLAGATVTEPIVVYPLILSSTPAEFGGDPITGIDVINFDMDSAGTTAPPDIRIETSGTRGANLNPSQDNGLFTTNLRGIDVGNMDGRDYGVYKLKTWNLSQVMEGANDLEVYTVQICNYGSGVIPDEFPILPGDPRNPYRIYYPRDDGTIPRKETMVHSAAVVAGPDPPLVGAGSVIEVTLEIRNPSGYDLTEIDVYTRMTPDALQFTDPQIQSTTGGLSASVAGRDIHVTGSVAAGQTGKVFYRTTFSPGSVGTFYITGDGTDLQGGTLPTEGTYQTPFTQPPGEEHFGPIHMLRTSAQESACAATAVLTGDPDICVPDPVVFMANDSVVLGCPGVPEYRWLRDGVEWMPYPAPFGVADYPTADTFYAVEVRCSLIPACMDSEGVMVIVHPAVTADAGPGGTTCEGDGIALGGAPTASGGTGSLSCQWSPVQDLDDPAACNPVCTPSSPTSPLTYTVTVTDSVECKATASAQVEVTANVAESVGNTLALAKEGDDIRLTWRPNQSSNYNVRRHDSKMFDRPTSTLLNTVTTGDYLAQGEISTGPPEAYYRVFAVGCRGSEEP
jgi:hypothetical protein